MSFCLRCFYAILGYDSKVHTKRAEKVLLGYDPRYILKRTFYWDMIPNNEYFRTTNFVHELKRKILLG